MSFYAFEDMMHDQIRIERNAREYGAAARIAQEEFGPAKNGGRQSNYYAGACEAIFAVHKIMGNKL